MDDTELDAIRKRLAKATEGPWRVVPTFDTDDTDPDGIRGARLILAGERTYVAETLDGTNAELLAHSWQDIRDLLAEIDRLQEALDNVEPDWRYE